MTSVAQQIPSIILEKVIDYTLYATSAAEPPYHHCICFPYRHAVLLLGVCRWWRGLALSTVYCEVHWCIDPECSLCAGCRRNGCSSLRTFANALGSGHLGFARTVRIHCRIEDIAGGAAIDTLRNAAFTRLAVPGVRSLEFHFSSITDRSKFILLNETTPAALFCDEIRQMFPSVHSVAVSDLAFQYWHYHETFVKRLLSGLFAGIPSVHTAGAYPALDKVLSVNPTSIRSLSVGGVWPTEPKIELIRRHSETLEYLCVSDDTPEAFHDILVRYDGRPIEYPRVRTLILDLDTLMYTRKQVVYRSPEGMPFPSLQHLVCIPEYPFANDILFRGNEDRLEVIRIHVTPPVIRALTRDGVARIGRFPALHFAEVTMLDTDSDNYMQLDPDGYDSDDSDSSFISAYHYEGYESDMAQLIFSMGQNARIVKSTNYFTDFSSVQLRYSDIGRYIKVLDMRFIGFTLGQQLELIKHLTCLTHFGASLQVTDDLHGYSIHHIKCRGPCTQQPGYSDRIRSMRGRYLPYFVHDHLGQLSSVLFDIQAHYDIQYPASESLVQIFGDISGKQDQWAHLASYAVLMLLCPSLKSVQECKKGTALHRKSDTPDYEWMLDRQTMMCFDSFSRATEKVQESSNVSK